MRNIIVLILSVLPLISFSQVRADFTFSRFYAPGQGPYIETYLNIDGRSINYTKSTSDKLYQGTVEVSIAFFKNDTAIAFDKYQVVTPKFSNPDSAVADIIDKQRFRLPDGQYNLEISIDDINDDNEKRVEGSYSLGVGSSDSVAFFSDILYVYNYEKASPEDPYSKSGLKITPHVFDLYDDNMNSLTFYTELYNTDKIISEDEAMAVNYFIKDKKSNKLMSDFGGINRYNPKPVNVIFKTIDINKLASGEYELWVELIDKSGNLIADQAISFSRINYHHSTVKSSTSTGSFQEWVISINSLDSLEDMCWCLVPIASNEEANVLKVNEDNMELNFYKEFFINFWLDKDPVDPWSEWLPYEEQVKKVNSEYSTSNTRGYETDRGFIYLKYGPPNTITKRENEPNSYPYHIWHYYKHPKRSDAKYIFYSTDRSTNDYRILHSNVIGEINNYRWKIELQKQSTPYGTVDDEDVDNQWGGWSEDLFNLPR